MPDGDEIGGYVEYDEFGFWRAMAAELDVDLPTLPRVERRSVEVGPGRSVSLLVWGEGEPELVFLHGGGQNAHTWDSVALVLGRPMIAVDLPGHGRSDWRADRDYWPWSNAEAVATVVDRFAPRARAVVGMSLGGLTAIRLAATRPDLVRKAVVVDVTPGVGARTAAMSMAQRGASSLVSGPPAYPSFEEMLARTVAASPHRDPVALRRGVLHNAKQLEDGRWAWRYDRLDGTPEFTALWEDVSLAEMPMMLVRGATSVHVHDDDEEEFRRRRAGLRVEVVEGAGHAVQSDRPRRLAGLIEDFVFPSAD